MTVAQLKCAWKCADYTTVWWPQTEKGCHKTPGYFFFLLNWQSDPENMDIVENLNICPDNRPDQ